MKVALVYDRVNKFGGAERVLLALHEIWPDAPLYTSVYDHEAAPWANIFDVRTSFIQKTPLPKTEHEKYPFLMGLAFETFNFDAYDMVISMTHEFAKSIITKPGTFHLCYCLTPVSYLWSGYRQYFQRKSRLFKIAAAPLVSYLRFYDKIAAQRPDRYLAISGTVGGRIKKYYGLESRVVYPPVNTAPETKYVKGDYFLIVSRLVPNKRIDLAVRAFNRLGLPLTIVGTGKEEKYLKSISRDNIRFAGGLTDRELYDYYDHCRAVVIPGEEDFNIVAVEAQSHGRPVIAFGRGGVTETVVNGKTGWFFDEDTPDSLEKLVRQIKPEVIKSADCRLNAQRFSRERFISEFKKITDEEYRRYKESYAL